MKINTHIPQKWDDQVFYFARKLEFRKNRGWSIIIDPNECLVGMQPLSDEMPDIYELRSSQVKRTVFSDGFDIEGRILISGGVLLLIKDKYLLFFRDSEAPVAPEKWTSAAGRLDRAPLLTALKEFYEEVIILNNYSNQPVFLDIQGVPYKDEIINIYRMTLRGKGYPDAPAKWNTLKGVINNAMLSHTNNVNIRFGDDYIDCSLSGKVKFLSFFIKETNTLELLLPVKVEESDIHIPLLFIDGEYERKFQLFSSKDLFQISDENLVFTMVEVKKILQGDL